jgi:hypothetical protein
MRTITLSADNILNLDYLLQLQPPLQLLRWLRGFNNSNRWDASQIPRPEREGEPAAANQGRRRRQPRAEGSTAAALNNNSRRSVRQSAATNNNGDDRRTQRPAQDSNRQQTVRRFSNVFMPIIAAAADIIPVQGTDDRHNFDLVRGIIDPDVWNTIINAYRQDFAVRNERPFEMFNDTYGYLQDHLQERLLFPIQPFFEMHGQSHIGHDVFLLVQQACAQYTAALNQNRHP